ncbi:MAG TPA: alpha/beta fold hydrolase [Terracidiphilus sp.]|nr:alpha/beta fold hydrolase [Terracidiphilus sp.]
MRTSETPNAGKRSRVDSPDDSPSRAHRAAFSYAISCVSRFMILRDRALGWTKLGRVPAGIHERVSRHTVPGTVNLPTHLLDAVFVEPAAVPARAAILLCHGIGETVEQWFGVQQFLAAHGVASLVFDYSGYGKSTGRPHWEQFELDAVAAFAALKELAPSLPISVLGFSLGSGVATAIIDRLGAHRLILCEAFTSFRHAAVSVGIPRPLARLVPPIWHAQRRLAECKLPVLIVHGEKDRLFPIAMAHELAGWCEPRAQVILVPNTSHNQPFRKPHLSYWGPIIDWICKE